MKKSIAILAAAVAIASSACAQQKKFPLSAPATIAFDPAQRLVFMDVSVNGSRPLSFVLDTGNKYTIVDIGRAKQLGLDFGREIRIQGSGATTSGAFIRNAAISVSALPGFSQPVTLAIPLAPLAARFGHPFDGILGEDFIRQFVVEIDPRAQKLRLYDRDTFHYAGNGVSMPIRIDSSGHPVLHGQLTITGDRVPVDLVIDTGSTGSLVLHSAFVAANHLPGPGVRTIRNIPGAGVGGRTTGRIGRIRSLELGGLEVRTPVTVFSEDTSGAFASSDTAGTVGARILEHFRLFLDYAHDRLILEPYAASEPPSQIAFPGVLVEAEGPDFRTYRVTDVLEGSAAAEANLRAGDIILAIDDRPAAQLSLTEITGLFERAAACRLKIRRGNDTIETTMTPRREF